MYPYIADPPHLCVFAPYDGAHRHLDIAVSAISSIAEMTLTCVTDSTQEHSTQQQHIQSQPQARVESS
jgi:hypothetical protein